MNSYKIVFFSLKYILSVNKFTMNLLFLNFFTYILSIINFYEKLQFVSDPLPLKKTKTKKKLTKFFC